MASTRRRKNVLLLTSPRTRSNLTFRWLCTSKDVHPIQYPFMTAARYGKRENCVAYYLRHSKERHEELLSHQFGEDTPEQSAVSLLKDIQDADNSGKMTVVVEQWDHLVKVQQGLDILRVDPCILDTNPTYLPDDILSSITPVILIRNPLAVVDSSYRLVMKRKYGPEDEDFRMTTTSRAQRLLFDHLNARGLGPIVVDSWDVLTKTEYIANQLAHLLGIGGMTDEWTPVDPEEIARMNPKVADALERINASSGFERPENASAVEADSETSYRQWQANYGDDVAAQLKRAADESMPHYEHLRQFRL